MPKYIGHLIAFSMKLELLLRMYKYDEKRLSSVGYLKTKAEQTREQTRQNVSSVSEESRWARCYTGALHAAFNRSRTYTVGSEECEKAEASLSQGLLVVGYSKLYVLHAHYSTV
jgi:hypothetical protein